MQYPYIGLNIVNASYEELFNVMNIYPIWLLSPQYDSTMSDACNYATFSVIGHEMTHGFDKKGSQYDSKGISRNWWTVADKMEFEERQQLLIDCYNNLELMPDELPNMFANGEATITENMADLGGVLIAYDAYMEKLAADGFTGDELIKQEKRFFQAYADLWRNKYTAEYAQNCKQAHDNGEDNHSTYKERINGVVMNIDRWYELYDVQWGDNLYLSPERRSYIW